MSAHPTSLVIIGREQREQATRARGSWWTTAARDGFTALAYRYQDAMTSGALQHEGRPKPPAREWRIEE